MAEHRICINCDHWRYYHAEQGYSEVTPSVNVAVFCVLGHWKIDPYLADQERYRKFLLSAETCTDFSPVKEEG